MTASETGSIDHRSHGRPIRVLHFVSTFATKTDTKWLLQLLSRMPRDRVSVGIACMYGGGPMRERFEQIGVRTFSVDAPKEWSLSAVRGCGRVIRAFEPDVVHTHLLRADLYAGLAGRLAGVPVVLSTQYAIGPFRRAVKRRLDPVLDLACRLIATDALAVAGAVRDDLIARVGWAADRVHVVHTGVEVDGWTRAVAMRAAMREKLMVPADVPLVMTTARLSYEKGVDVLIRAAERVRQQVPRVRFAVAGDGPLAEPLRAQVRAAGLGDVVHLVGFQQDVPALLAAADVFVLPSLMEGMPNSALEAMAAGLPVVASRVGGLAELIEHERSGLLVEVGRPEELAAAIARVLGDEALRQALSYGGRARVQEQFSVEQVARRYADLYARLLSDRTRCRRARSEKAFPVDLGAPSAKRGGLCGMGIPRKEVREGIHEPAVREGIHEPAENPPAGRRCHTGLAMTVELPPAAPVEWPPAVRLDGIPVTCCTRDELIEGTVQRARDRVPTRLSYLNAHVFNLARQDATLREALVATDVLYPDGMSVVWAARLLGYAAPERLTAADYFEQFCRRCASEGLGVFLLGGESGVAERAAEHLRAAVPGLRVAGVHDGHFDEADSTRVVESINASGADVLIVGMGSPRQETWLMQHGARIRVPVQWSVGALLDYFAGVEPRAPQWLCKIGGEWLFRLSVRPRQRWRRYVLGNARFVCWLMRAWLARPICGEPA